MQRKYARLPDSKVYGANMGPTWVLSVQDGPHVGAMKLANRVIASKRYSRRKEIDTTARESLALIRMLDPTNQYIGKVHRSQWAWLVVIRIHAILHRDFS